MLYVCVCLYFGWKVFLVVTQTESRSYRWCEVGVVLCLFFIIVISVIMLRFFGVSSSSSSLLLLWWWCVGRHRRERTKRHKNSTSIYYLYISYQSVSHNFLNDDYPSTSHHRSQVRCCRSRSTEYNGVSRNAEVIFKGYGEMVRFSV